MRYTSIGAIISVAFFASTVSAEEIRVAFDDTATSYAAQELSTGDWSSAEAALVGGEFSEEDQVFAKLNLAFVYSTTGRRDQAVAIYRDILADKENPYALLRNGEPRRVKTIAMTALNRLGE
ncbi:hypothetical protein [Kordiimonas pumila]|uniref:Tetratricopeptide repeat protein n=1 Tax=Kordiimonas pumila TaxID=2161677 RepID=A0ABV7D811_9PROT|nr:hypothetical protein [Kordiimonas pumila]